LGIPRRKNGQVGQHKTTGKVTAGCEMSSRRGTKARYETQCLTAGEDVNKLSSKIAGKRKDFHFKIANIFCLKI